MELEEIKDKAIDCVETRLAKKKIKNNIDLTMTHLIEEFGELALQINNGKLKRKEIDVKNIGEEISDCMILLMMLSRQYNIDLEKQILEKIKIIKNSR